MVDSFWLVPRRRREARFCGAAIPYDILVEPSAIQIQTIDKAVTSPDLGRVWAVSPFKQIPENFRIEHGAGPRACRTNGSVLKFGRKSLVAFGRTASAQPPKTFAVSHRFRVTSAKLFVSLSGRNRTLEIIYQLVIPVSKINKELGILVRKEG